MIALLLLIWVVGSAVVALEEDYSSLTDEQFVERADVKPKSLGTTEVHVIVKCGGYQVSDDQMFFWFTLDRQTISCTNRKVGGWYCQDPTLQEDVFDFKVSQQWSKIKKWPWEYRYGLFLAGTYTIKNKAKRTITYNVRPIDVPAGYVAETPKGQWLEGNPQSLTFIFNKKDCTPSPLPKPTAIFEVNPVSGSLPLTSKFIDHSDAGKDSRITSWNWDFGDTGTSTEQNPEHTYTTQRDSFTASLTVCNNWQQCDSAQKTITITPIPPPEETRTTIKVVVREEPDDNHLFQYDLWRLVEDKLNGGTREEKVITFSATQSSSYVIKYTPQGQIFPPIDDGIKVTYEVRDKDLSGDYVPDHTGPLVLTASDYEGDKTLYYSQKAQPAGTTRFRVTILDRPTDNQAFDIKVWKVSGPIRDLAKEFTLSQDKPYTIVYDQMAPPTDKEPKLTYEVFAQDDLLLYILQGENPVVVLSQGNYENEFVVDYKYNGTAPPPEPEPKPGPGELPYEVQGPCTLNFNRTIELNETVKEEPLIIEVSSWIGQNRISYIRASRAQGRTTGASYNGLCTEEYYDGTCWMDIKGYESFEHKLETPAAADGFQVITVMSDGTSGQEGLVSMRVRVWRKLDPTQKIEWEGWSTDRVTTLDFKIHASNVSCRTNNWASKMYSSRGPFDYHSVYPNGLSPASYQINLSLREKDKKAQELHCRCDPTSSECINGISPQRTPVSGVSPIEGEGQGAVIINETKEVEFDPYDYPPPNSPVGYM